MFTGIIQSVGEVLEITNKENRISARIICTFKNLYLGQSIAIDGACLTLVKKQRLFFKNKSIFEVDVSKETLSKTNIFAWRVGSKVNLEKSLNYNGKIDGHFVLGHVDSIGKVQDIIKLEDNYKLNIQIDKNFTKNVVYKGSVCVNGVSLTINEVEGDVISLNIIPYTWQHTSFNTLKTGDTVNIEYDILGKYILNHAK